MSGPSNTWKANFGNYLFGQTAIPTPPATLYLAAYTVMPADDGTGGTEVTIGQGGYARVAISNDTTNWPAALAANPTVNKLAIAFAFPQATADWASRANIVGFGLYDAASGGNFIASAYAMTAIGIASVSTVDGTFTFTAPHGRSAGDAMGMFISAGGSLPTGFGPWNTNLYYVIASGLTATTLKLSATQGGAAIIPTTAEIGALFVGYSFVAPVVNQTTLTIPANALQFSTTGR